MLRTKPVLLFLLKAVLIYALLSAPFAIYDSTYGTFYRACCKKLFAKIDGNGFALFKEIKGQYDIQISIGNNALVKANGKTNTFIKRVNSHYSGYIPTALFISLVLATPLPWRRKVLSLIAGFILLSCFIMFKQWIQLLYICEQNKWLQLYDFSAGQQKMIEYLYPRLVPYLGTSWFFVVTIWLLVSFRKDDLTMITKIKGIGAKP